MKFYLRNVRLVSKRCFQSRNGKDLCFLRVANPDTFESGDFLPVQGVDVSTLEEGKDYSAVLHVDGRYSNIELVPPIGDK